MPKKNRLESFGSGDGSSDGTQEESSAEQTHDHTHIRWRVGETEQVLSGEALKALMEEIEWVRLVLHQDQRMGIGYVSRRSRSDRPTAGPRSDRPAFQLVHLLATGEVGLVRRVSTAESAVVLRDLAEMEQEELPDIESNAAAWVRWLRTLTKEFNHG